LEILKNRQVDVENFISEEFGLSEGVRAMERAAAKGMMKVLLAP
jgi:hypothetical protein